MTETLKGCMVIGLLGLVLFTGCWAGHYLGIQASQVEIQALQDELDELHRICEAQGDLGHVCQF